MPNYLHLLILIIYGIYIKITIINKITIMFHSRLTHCGLLTAVAALLSSCIFPTTPLGENWNDRSSYHWEQTEPTKEASLPSLPLVLPYRSRNEDKTPKLLVLGPCPPLLFNTTTNRASKLRVRTTAYTHTESDHLAYGKKNAIGTDLKFGDLRSAAADWSRYPVGTRFRIVGQPEVLYVVDDYGSALVGTGTIDLYKPSKSLMNNWGVRHVDIQVVKWGSYERSMQLMRDRTRWQHVRRMMEGINARMRLVEAVQSKEKDLETASL